MRALFAVCCPGAAEGLAPVIRSLQYDRDQLTVIGVDAKSQQRFSGSASVFQRAGIPYVEAEAATGKARCTELSEVDTQRLLHTCQPDLIVVGTSRDPEGLTKGLEEHLVVGAARSQLPAVQFVDSWEAWYPKHYPGYAAHAYLVPDDLTQQVVHRRGAVPLERIRVTGNPAWEELAAPVTVNRTALRQQLGIEPQHRLLVYFGGATSDDPTSLYWIFRHRLPMDRVLFRRHPRDFRDYRQLIGDFPDAFIDMALSADELLSCADVCLTHHGAMGMKAALLGIPTINIIMPGDCDELCQLCGGFPLALLGGSFQVETEREYQEIITRVTPPRAAALKTQLRLDGQTSSRVVHALREIAGSPQRTTPR